jgi:hypothetical protein
MRYQHIVIDESLHDKLRRYSVETRRSLKDTCEIILGEFFDNIDKNQNNK